MVIDKAFTEKMTVSVYTGTGNYLNKDTTKEPINHASRLIGFYDEAGDLVVIPMHNVKKIVFHY